MDIEGYEYIFLNSLSEQQLSCFKQMVIEFHGVFDDSWGLKYEDKKKSFEKLKKTHYIVHVHGNNYSDLTNNIPDVLEITFIRKNCLAQEPKTNKTKFPIDGLDFPNNINGGVPDYNLDFFPFVDKN
jgi:hypothetical protein